MLRLYFPILLLGVGFAHTPGNSQLYDLRRKELLRLLETCFSHIMYLPAPSSSGSQQTKLPPTVLNGGQEQVSYIL